MQGALHGFLHHGAVGNRVRVGHHELDDICTATLCLPHQLKGDLFIGITCNEACDEERAACSGERLPYPRCHRVSPARAATCATSLSPRPERLITRMSSFASPDATLSASETACADSSAGMIPSVLER